MASIPLTSTLIKIFKVQARIVGDIEKWEACMVSNLLAGVSILDWLNEVYRLQIFLQKNRWPALASFDPEAQFYRFMDEWRSQVLTVRTRQLVDESNARLQTMVSQPRCDLSQEGRAASRILAFLGLEAEVSDEDLQPMNESSEDELTVAGELLCSMSTSSSRSSSLNSTPEATEKRPVALPFPVVPVALKYDSLTMQMLQQLNLKPDCAGALNSLEVNLKFRIRIKKIPLTDILAMVRAFCRTNAGDKGFYDEQGCLASLVQSWHQAELKANLANQSESVSLLKPSRSHHRSKREGNFNL